MVEAIVEAMVRFHAAGTPVEVPLDPGTHLTFGRTSPPAHVVIGDDPSLSRLALVVRLQHNGAVMVAAKQRFGHIAVHRSDGTVAAHLQVDEILALPAGVWRLDVVGSHGKVAELHLATTRSGSQPTGVVAPGQVTQGQIHAADLLRSLAPPWMVVAVLAAVLARRALRAGARSPGEREALLSAARAWYAREWSSGWLTNRVDEAIHEFHIGLRPGADKVPALADHVLQSQIVSQPDLDHLDAELRRRETAASSQLPLQ